MPNHLQKEGGKMNRIGVTGKRTPSNYTDSLENAAQKLHNLKALLKDTLNPCAARGQKKPNNHIPNHNFSVAIKQVQFLLPALQAVA
jgi:hypothetical protein